MTNTRTLKSRNQREGKYKGKHRQYCNPTDIVKFRKSDFPVRHVRGFW